MKGKHYRLHRELSLFQAVLYGIGIILGAGIYVLLGVGAGIAGNAIWLSFLVAAFIAFFTGMSYAELSSMYSKDAAEYVYTEKAFRRKRLSFIVQWVMIFTGIVSSATVALGFGGYFERLTGIPAVAGAALLIYVLSIISYIGIKLSTAFATYSAIIEMSGLLLVAVIGAFFIGGDINYFYSPGGMAGILSATALIFFAYIGFEEMVQFSEETKNARKVMPKALLISLAVSTVLYMLVSVSAISVLGWEALSKSSAPLADVVAKALPEAAFLMSVIALFATGNTVLIMLIVASRILYGLGNTHAMPKVLSFVGRRGTPYVSIFIVMVLSIIALSVGGLKTVALLTDVGIFLVYVFVNAALIWLRYREPKAERLFISPVNIGKFPVLAGLGILASVLMFFHFEPEILLFEIGVVLAGFGAYRLINR
ncbi:MAG: amino acid permease [Candidatus Aenigmarchaeota archaeon]|nr:amino acid permease [Candidatus Aenigmarchaeota archaeon]